MFSLYLTSQPLLTRALLDACVGFAVVIVARILWYQLRSAYHLRNVPGPKAPSWLWGSEWDLHKASPGQRYLEWKARYGDVIKIKGALGRNLLAISDARAAKYILEEHVFDFPKPQGVREWFRLLVGEGLLVVEGKEAHTHQRRLFTPALNTSAIRPLLSTFYAISAKMADTISSRLDRTPGESIEEDIQWWTNRISLDNIGLAGFSYDFNSISGDSDPLAHALEALTNSADNFSSFVMKALFYTFPWILRVPSEKAKHINNTREELGKVAMDMWNQAKAAGSSVEGKTLMASMKKADVAASMSQEQIAAQLRTLVQAGYETVGCTMSWLIYEIARNPHVQARIREEVSATPSEPSFDDLWGHERMPYLDATIKECLRLHPPVLELTHVAAKDTLVPLSKPLPTTGATQMLIPKGTIINIPVNLVQADPEVWGPDAAEFKPERWLGMDTNYGQEKLGRRDVLAFSAGPRICPGRHFAMLEMKTTVAYLLRQFVFAPVPTKPIEPFWSFVVRQRVKGQKEGSLPLLVSRVKY